MAKYTNRDFDDLDITKAELKEIGEALKKEEFRKLLGDYVNEVSDPKNRAIYENELTQLEKERGVDIIFVSPEPGYVIKTSVDGVQKAFINVCSNVKIGKPSAVKRIENGHQGNDWSIPYILAPSKVDLDKSKQRCVVYDVVFHPETLAIASKTKEFKNLVNDTAISGIEDAFNVKFDRNNIKFPKLDFKGPKIASVIRKKSDDSAQQTNEEPLNIPNYPYKPIKENEKPMITKPRKGNYESKADYTIPKYIIKYRKGIEFHEFTDSKDAKMHAVIPSDLVIEVDLLLLSSASDAQLDVTSRSLSLVSEKPSKYKLEIKLPYEVNEENGSAKFDKRTKKLIINLPVVKKLPDLAYMSREDSGIESDPSHNRSSSDEDLSKPGIIELSSCDKLSGSENLSDGLRTSGEFLLEHLHYSFPDFSITNTQNSITVTVNAKNIEPTTVSHQNIFLGHGVHFKFSSMGSGYFQIHYSFCIHFPNFLIEFSTLNVEVWDNNLIINMELSSESDSYLSSYFVGPNEKCLEKREFKNIIKTVSNSSLKKFEDIEEEEQEKVEVCVNEVFLREDISDEASLCTNTVQYQEETSPSPEELEHKVEDLNTNLSVININSTKNCTEKKLTKLRTSSESNETSSSQGIFSRRSILKNSRSLSESNTDEYNTWSSLDSSDNTEDANNAAVKKTVRFSDVISKKVFRANSSILGQKYKNEKKSRNRKKVARRRASESDADASEVSDYSDYSEVSDVSETSDLSSDDQPSSTFAPPPQLPSGKKHRRRGSKNSRKNAATAKQNSFILSHD